MPASRFTKDEVEFLTAYSPEWISAGSEKAGPGQQRPRHKLLARIILDFYEHFEDRRVGGKRAFEDDFESEFLSVRRDGALCVIANFQ